MCWLMVLYQHRGLSGQVGAIIRALQMQINVFNFIRPAGHSDYNYTVLGNFTHWSPFKRAVTGVTS